MSRGSGLVRRRAAAQAALLAAAATVLLPALVLVTLVRMHTAAADRDGLRKAFSDIPVAARTVVAAYDIGSKWPGPGPRADTDRRVRASVADAFGAVPVGVDTAVASVAYGVDTVTPPVSVYFLAATGDLAPARLTSGQWPQASPDGTVVQAAIPEAAAQAEHWKVGDTVAVASRLDSAKAVFRVSGIYQPTDISSLFWQHELFGGRQSGHLDRPTFGPLLVDPSLTVGSALEIKTLAYFATPVFTSVTSDQAAGLSERTAILDAALKADAPDDIQPTVWDTLGAHTAGITVGRQVSDRLNLLQVLQLVLLAGTALVLTARLLAEYRRESDGLLRARGASVRGLLRIGVSEGLLLAIPVAIVAPFAARRLDRRLTAGRWSARTTPPISAGHWLVACAAAGLTVVLLATAGLGGALSFVGVKRSKSRSTARTVVQRTGLDVMVVALGAGALWEMLHASDAARAGRLGVPQAVAPSVLLLAAALVSLRLLPLLVGALEWFAARRRGVTGALAGWRVGRSARAYAAPLLLLIMAVAVGEQATVLQASADRSARDQAAYTVGADVRATSIPPGNADTTGTLAALPGAGGGTAVHHDDVSLGYSSSDTVQADVLGVDPARSANVVTLRSDQAAKPWPALVGALAADGWDARGHSGGIPLPGRPGDLSLTVRYSSGTTPSGLGPLSVQVALADDDGGLAWIPLGTVTAPDGAPHLLSAKVAPQAGGTIAYPLRLMSVLFTYYEPNCPKALTRCYSDDPSLTPVGDAEFTTIRMSGLTAGGALVPLPRDTPPRGYQSPVVGSIASADSPGPMHVDAGQGGDLAGVQQASGYGVDNTPLLAQAVTFAGAVKAVPALASADLLASLRAKVGDTYQTTAFGGDKVLLHFVGVADAIPGADPDPAHDPGRNRDVLVLPQDFFLWRDAPAGSGNAFEWWASAAAGSSPARLDARVQAYLARFDGTHPTADRQSLAAAQHDDPFAAGVRITLLVGAAAALLFILVGFSLHAVTTLRERSVELALLSALGLSRRRTLAVLLAEQALVVVLGTAAGSALAAVAVRSELSFMIFTDTGATPVPTPREVVDWPMLAGAVVVVVAFLFAASYAALRTRREASGLVLRAGTER